MIPIAEVSKRAQLARLTKVDWDFSNANTSYLTHNLHPYPARFIPQIPKVLIQELSSAGDTVLDPFCGSGTTLVEALTLDRNAIGLDANPIACLITEAKTVRLVQDEVGLLRELHYSLTQLIEQCKSGSLNLFDELNCNNVNPIPKSESINFWFDAHVVAELAHIKILCTSLPTPDTRVLALACFSSVVVAVSRQDSDTRYVRRDKNIQPGHAVLRFQRVLNVAIERATEFANLVDHRFKRQIVQANVLAPPDGLATVDLVVCSPPYPNAYSYHLYHGTRMLWLDIDPAPFKAMEIGSHRKYSSKGPNRATIETFTDEMRTVFAWLSATLKKGGYACFVIGDSILGGYIVHNHEMMKQVASDLGFCLSADIVRRLPDGKKSFNPKIGRIQHEHVIIFENTGG